MFLARLCLEQITGTDFEKTKFYAIIIDARISYEVDIEMWWRITDEHIKYRESDNIRDRET
jgi:hypothetical protein